MQKLSFILFIVVFLSCSNKGEQNFADINKVQKGMNIHEVRKIMRNNPKDILSLAGNDSIFLERYDSAAGSSDYYGIVIRKKDSIVIEIRYGD